MDSTHRTRNPSSARDGECADTRIHPGKGVAGAGLVAGARVDIEVDETVKLLERSARAELGYAQWRIRCRISSTGRRRFAWRRRVISQTCLRGRGHGTQWAGWRRTAVRRRRHSCAQKWHVHLRKDLGAHSAHRLKTLRYDAAPPMACFAKVQTCRGLRAGPLGARATSRQTGSSGIRTPISERLNDFLCFCAREIDALNSLLSVNMHFAQRTGLVRAGAHGLGRGGSVRMRGGTVGLRTL